MTFVAGQKVRASDLNALGGDANKIVPTESTSSTSYTDLTTVGPSASITLTVPGLVLVTVKAILTQTGAGGTVAMAWEASGATVQPASDTDSVHHNGSGSGESYAAIGVIECNAGTTTFTAKYRVTGGTGSFASRVISAAAL